MRHYKIAIETPHGIGIIINPITKKDLTFTTQEDILLYMENSLIEYEVIRV